ncbi:MAG: DUF1835 domain-containing protein, partial [Polyangiaceae bacterium]|nr:DUF1835 domain-containing protein [Polyangiaceae bacterium]
MARYATAHVFAGRANAELLRQLRRFPRDSIVTLIDDLATGPLPPLTQPAEWWAKRREYWTNMRPLAPETRDHEMRLLLNEGVLTTAERVVL